MKTLLAVAAVILFLAGATTTTAQELEETVTLQIGEAAEFGEPPTTLAFTSLVYDGRCPLNAICVWEGVAEVELRLTAPDGSEEVFLLYTRCSISHLLPPEQTIGGYDITLEALEPYPVDPRQTGPEDYTLTLRVQSASRVPLEPMSWSVLKSDWDR